MLPTRLSVESVFSVRRGNCVRVPEICAVLRFSRDRYTYTDRRSCLISFSRLFGSILRMKADKVAQITEKTRCPLYYIYDKKKEKRYRCVPSLTWANDNPFSWRKLRDIYRNIRIIKRVSGLLWWDFNCSFVIKTVSMWNAEKNSKKCCRIMKFFLKKNRLQISYGMRRWKAAPGI